MFLNGHEPLLSRAHVPSNHSYSLTDVYFAWFSAVNQWNYIIYSYLSLLVSNIGICKHLFCYKYQHINFHCYLCIVWRCCTYNADCHMSYFKRGLLGHHFSYGGYQDKTQLEEGSIYYGLQFMGYCPSWSHHGMNSRQLVTLHLYSGSREQWMLVLSLLSSFSSV